MILFGKPEGKRTLGEPGVDKRINIVINHREIGFGLDSSCLG
jgi:hypothetical protein